MVKYFKHEISNLFVGAFVEILNSKSRVVEDVGYVDGIARSSDNQLVMVVVNAKNEAYHIHPSFLKRID